MTLVNQADKVSCWKHPQDPHQFEVKKETNQNHYLFIHFLELHVSIHKVLFRRIQEIPESRQETISVTLIMIHRLRFQSLTQIATFFCFPVPQFFRYCWDRFSKSVQFLFKFSATKSFVTYLLTNVKKTIRLLEDLHPGPELKTKLTKPSKRYNGIVPTTPNT